MDTHSLAVAVVIVASMLIVGRLSRERGRRSLPWVVTASIIGPFAIAFFYLAEAASALRKKISASRP